ncbi:MAG: hypothetical protein HY895_12985 [Deltaproteobacteria bacterium]|nr:hypothetical protein [Deltaproteobacteria bacterium]
MTIIANAPASDRQRDKWLERLWQAVEDDGIPCLDVLPDHWGELCATPERASDWADEFIAVVRMAWSPNPELRGYFKGTAACLSALLKAGRNAEVMELLERAPHRFWHDRKWGVKALLAIGKKAEALRFAENSRGLNEPSLKISEACEEILLASGRIEEAYSRYAIEANQKSTRLATFRGIAKKYPHIKPADILKNLVASTPGNEGKWFAAAKSAELYDEAIELANRNPCDPRTLTRAAWDMAETGPRFAVEAGVAALRWLVEGHGYEIAGLDVRAAYDCTMKAAENAGCKPETFKRIRELVAGENFGERFVTRILGHELGLR